ncbi:hypothetical protein [Bacillus canaveralius]|nr:hypothetical protein [Bacillus canaveralius]
MKAFMPQLIFYEQQRLIVRFRLEIKDKLEYHPVNAEVQYFM